MRSERSHRDKQDIHASFLRSSVPRRADVLLEGRLRKPEGGEETNKEEARSPFAWVYIRRVAGHGGSSGRFPTNSLCLIVIRSSVRGHATKDYPDIMEAHPRRSSAHQIWHIRSAELHCNPNGLVYRKKLKWRIQLGINNRRKTVASRTQ